MCLGLLPHVSAFGADVERPPRLRVDKLHVFVDRLRVCFGVYDDALVQMLLNLYFEVVGDPLVSDESQRGAFVLDCL